MTSKYWPSKVRLAVTNLGSINNLFYSHVHQKKCFILKTCHNDLKRFYHMLTSQIHLTEHCDRNKCQFTHAEPLILGCEGSWKSRLAPLIGIFAYRVIQFFQVFFFNSPIVFCYKIHQFELQQLTRVERIRKGVRSISLTMDQAFIRYSRFWSELSSIWPFQDFIGLYSPIYLHVWLPFQEIHLHNIYIKQIY